MAERKAGGRMRKAGLFGLAALVAANLIYAQEQTPARAVWIVNMRGEVSFLVAGGDPNKDWGPAEINRQMGTGDQLATVDDGTAELHVDNHVLHLGPGTAIEFGKVESGTLVIDLHQGTLSAQAAPFAGNEVFEIDTVNMSMTLAQPGNYSFELDPTGNTKNIVVQNGLCQAVSQAGETFAINGGQSASVGQNGQQTTMAYNTLPNNLPQPPEQAEPQGPPPNAIGPQDQQQAPPGENTLGIYGQWQPAPDNSGGQVWYPNVAADWAPYTQGQWEFIEPGGWTWVDSEPWGFTPFHYGRWG